MEIQRNREKKDKDTDSVELQWKITPFLKRLV